MTLGPHLLNTKLLKGRGIADMTLIKRICGADPEMLDLLDKVTVQHQGAPAGNTNASNTIVGNVNNCMPLEHIDGNGKQYALRKLRADRPDLLEQVIRGEKSPHADSSADEGWRGYKVAKPFFIAET